ncbi:hypothetical protein BO71DRAFT_393818 [Aspergillus ellipticus CBS 707.79]|uniref:Uncharacterized protein n=1 Tax=Aspergillus ellipticus CBS 707.79 TaxID=1448320 RepID=A0A319EGE7_9EURO|nr:hypothetical protein BO71DRAFT_393818 [Aspergillus ellipticus CBS 707.79]
MPLHFNSLYKSLKGKNTTSSTRKETNDIKPFAKHLEDDSSSILSESTIIPCDGKCRSQKASSPPSAADSMDYGSTRYMSRGMFTRA